MAHQETQNSLADLLLDYLKELDDDELKKFKWKLNRTKYKELKPLPRGQVKHLDRTDLADMMISYYMEVGAIEVTLEILKNMTLNDLAERLNEDLQKCPQAGSELGDILEQNTIMSERPKPSGAQEGKGGREEEEKRGKDRGELMSSMIKCTLKQNCECVFEGKAKGGQRTLLNEIYTELYITEDGVHSLICGISSTCTSGFKRGRLALLGARLNSCDLRDKQCEVLTSALRSNSSPLRELDLSDNNLKDSGVKLLSAALGDLHCKLEILRLSGCRVTEEGCSSLASALRSNPSHLRELDLSYNHPGDSGVKLLSAVLEDSSCKLGKLNVDHCGECRTRPGLQKYSCQLTLDPNTANRHLSLSGGNRKARRGSEDQPHPDHPERFEYDPQVLCRESLTGRCYWEAEWDGDGAWIGVTYKGIGRKGESDDCGLGLNNKSWILWCDRHIYSVLHNNKGTFIPIEPSGSRRVGVYLDWGAGALSFYRVSSDGLTLLYRFTSSFTEPLYPGFRVNRKSSVSL
ncbi:uncharacterized protein [Paramormyrops kingsleyae]|uniref:uncharacterized protein isoform X3 n=1 Tax=Paramormyrops kingsleyae TaxID=1676925 RepID=UPI003B972814